MPTDHAPLFLCPDVESRPVIFGPQAKQTKANIHTHTHTQRYQASLDPNSLRRLKYNQRPVAGYTDWLPGCSVSSGFSGAVLSVLHLLKC